MRKKILLIDVDKERFSEVEWEFLSDKEFINISSYTISMLKMFIKENDFYLIIISFSNLSITSYIRTIRSITNTPILVLQENYNALEKIAVIEAGADEYLQWSENVQEIIVSCQALIRRYTMYEQKNIVSTEERVHGSVVINEDKRKIFIYGEELRLARREFDLFRLISTYPERVFTYEQLFEQIWNVGKTPTENSLHSCVRRIRRELESILECPCSIKNVRGVGYCFKIIKKEKAALP